jgi:hypothetical protein
MNWRYGVMPVAGDESARVSKKERREQRSRAARRQRLLTKGRRLGVAAAILAALGLWAFEHSGRQELVEAEVIETRCWKHFDNGSEHPHTSAKLQIEGLSEATLDRADGYQRGQRIPVWIRRGRISAWPYFLDIAKADEIARERRREEIAERDALRSEVDE